MNRLLLPVVVLVASASVAVAAPQIMTEPQLEGIVAGHVEVNCSEHICGNNGWGNGMDGNNPGSFQGGTEPSKSVNDTNGPGINTNPTTSTGR
jgi:hypothetical protein